MGYTLQKKIQLKLIYLSAKKLGLEYIGGHFVHTKSIPTNGIVLDVGANKGNFAKAVIERCNVQCFCVEANPVLYNQLPKGNQIFTINKALTGKDVSIAFNISDNHEASSIIPTIANVWKINSTVTVEGVTLATLKKEYRISNIDVLKLDIEGAELEVLESVADEELQLIPQLTLEFHEFLDKTLAAATYQTIKRIQRLGFYTIVTSTEKYAEVLFLNKQKIRFGLIDFFWYGIHCLARYKH